MNKLAAIPGAVKSDVNLNRAGGALRRGASSFPSAASRYLLEKVPVVQWLPNYSPKWLLNDMIAGLTIGVLLVPQALAYAKIATIPLQDGLLASWLPSALYFFMGTSKDISTGPTSIIGLLTAQIIKDISTDGTYSPTAIASAIAFSVGIYSLIMGLFKLGFLLDFISLPVLTGFVGAAALTIMIGQIPALFGEKNVGSGVANQIHDIITKLPETKPLTFVIGFSGILLLQLMQYAGKKWGKQYKVIWILSIGRNAIVLALFTGISFALNKDLEKPLFDLTSTVPSGLLPPTPPDMTLVGKILTRSVAVFIAAALEHIAIAKSFARRNNYVVDQSQELTFLGTTNVLNSLFSGMAVGGAFSRTAVNSESGVKSPLSGLFTTGAVLVSLYFLTGALFWIPKATLSAVIVSAVWQILVPASVFYKYWKTSLADFISSMIAFWVTLFVSAETGIEAAAAFMIVYTLLRSVFVHTQNISSSTFSRLFPTTSQPGDLKLPPGVAFIRFSQSLTFLNAYSSKAEIMNAVQTYNLGVPAKKVSDSERLWSDVGLKNIAFLRQRAEINSSTLPQLRMLILDMTACAYVDTTGLQALIDMKGELLVYGGVEVELRFVGMSESVRHSFSRAGWKLGLEGEDRVFDSVAEAINVPRAMPIIYEQDPEANNYDDDAVLVEKRQRYAVSYEGH